MLQGIAGAMRTRCVIVRDHARLSQFLLPESAPDKMTKLRYRSPEKPAIQTVISPLTPFTDNGFTTCSRHFKWSIDYLSDFNHVPRERVRNRPLPGRRADAGRADLERMRVNVVD